MTICGFVFLDKKLSANRHYACLRIDFYTEKKDVEYLFIRPVLIHVNGVEDRILDEGFLTRLLTLVTSYCVSSWSSVGDGNPFIRRPSLLRLALGAFLVATIPFMRGPSGMF